jgi:uncharacterized protein
MVAKQPAHKDAAVIAQGGHVLEEMNELCTSLVYAALLTDDGFEIAHLEGSRITDGRFAGMASSLQALSEAVAHELRIGDSEYVIIAAKQGYVIQLRVPDQEIVLGALFDNDETLGKALSIARQGASKMASSLTPVS